MTVYTFVFPRSVWVSTRNIIVSNTTNVLYCIYEYDDSYRTYQATPVARLPKAQAPFSGIQKPGGPHDLLPLLLFTCCDDALAHHSALRSHRDLVVLLLLPLIDSLEVILDIVVVCIYFHRQLLQALAPVKRLSFI